MQVAEMGFRPTFNFAFDNFEFLYEIEHVRSCEIESPIFHDNSVNLMVLTPEVLKSEREHFVSV